MNADAYTAVPDLGNVSFGSGVFAYLDPGTGSMLVQLVVGGIAAA